MTAAPLLLAFVHAARWVAVAAAGLLPGDARWAAVSGCVRVAGFAAGQRAAAACVGYKDGHAYLLTASHAVPRGEARAFEFYTRESYPGPNRKGIGGEVVVRLDGPDVALVKVKVPGPVAVLPLAPPGERPKRFPFPAVSVGCPRGEPPACRAERVEGKKLARRSGGDVAFFWEVAERPVGGMSGGPLLDKAGRVIGVCTAAGPDGAGYFTHLDEILAGLKKNGFGWLIPPADR